MKWRWLSWPLLPLLLACSQQPPSEDYLRRLSRVLNVELPKASSARLEFPEPRQLRIEEPEYQISIREFLGLRDCKVHLAIAERNSQMGKVARSSQRLKIDLDILAHGPACLTKIENLELRNKLEAYLKVKRKALPQRLWHALLAEPEYRQLWHDSGHMNTYPTMISSAAQQLNNDLVALHDFSARVLAGQFEIDAKEFDDLERKLGRVRHADAGQLLGALSRLTVDIELANDAITQTLERKLCLKQTPTPAAKNFQTVVNKFFIAGVQAHAVELIRRHNQIMPSINKLEETLLPHAKLEFKRWVIQRNLEQRRAKNVTKEHALLIQRLFEQCGIAAGNRAS